MLIISEYALWLRLSIISDISVNYTVYFNIGASSPSFPSLFFQTVGWGKSSKESEEKDKEQGK